MKKIISMLLIAICCFCLCGCDGNPETAERVLTRDDIVELSKKGAALSWNDFKPFKHGEDIGSGLYITIYEIDDTFHLVVGGTRSIESNDGKIMYAFLTNKTTGEKIDILSEDPNILRLQE